VAAALGQGHGDCGRRPGAGTWRLWPPPWGRGMETVAAALGQGPNCGAQMRRHEPAPAPDDWEVR